MARTNRQILTKGSRAYASKKASKFGVDEVKYEPEKRSEYLTGFHKRKVERKEQRVQRAKDAEKEAHKAEMARIRRERNERVAKDMDRLNQAMRDVNGYIDEDEEEDQKDQKEPDQEAKKNDSDFSDWEGFDSAKANTESEKGILKRRTETLGDSSVTIEEFDSAVDMSMAEEVLKDSIKRAREHHTRWQKMLGDEGSDDDEPKKRSTARRGGSRGRGQGRGRGRGRGRK